jgi:hypothetical protein
LVNAISRSTVDSAARNAPFWNRYDVVGVMATGTILPIPSGDPDHARLFRIGNRDLV